LQLQRPFQRLLLGALLGLVIIIPGFVLVGALIPTWGSTPEESTRALPADDMVRTPTLTWNHAITIHAPAAQVYPWLVQIGDSRAAFYSITFIENAFCATSGACRYVNADRVHPEWQTPTKGAQGIIMNYMVINDYRSGQYVLATTTGKLPFIWTWLWYVQPVDANTSRLIVRHRVAFPTDAPRLAITLVFDAGFVMERAMMLGIQGRAEGIIPAPLEEPLGAAIWLLVFGMGAVCAVRFVRVADGYWALGTGLLAVIVLFVLTFVQPAMGWRLGLALTVAAGMLVAFEHRHLLRKVARWVSPPRP
jgi:hypothetical protein